MCSSLFSRGNQACARIANAKRTTQSRNAALRAHHTKSLRILCNFYSSGIKTNEFCTFGGSSAEFCLLSSAKL